MSAQVIRSAKERLDFLLDVVLTKGILNNAEHKKLIQISDVNSLLNQLADLLLQKGIINLEQYESVHESGVKKCT